MMYGFSVQVYDFHYIYRIRNLTFCFQIQMNVLLIMEDANITVQTLSVAAFVCASLDIFWMIMVQPAQVRVVASCEPVWCRVGLC